MVASLDELFTFNIRGRDDRDWLPSGEAFQKGHYGIESTITLMARTYNRSD